MKNMLLIISLTLNVVAAIIIFCCRCWHHDGDKCHEIKKQCVNYYMPASCDSPFHSISACLAQQLVLNYRRNHWNLDNNMYGPNGPFTSGDGKKVDSRAVWFSLEKLKRFIFEIESKTSNLSSLPGASSKNPPLGIRVYFAEYPDVPTWKATPELAQWSPNDGLGSTTPSSSDYANLHTLVLVPTYQYVNNNNGIPDTINVDFDPNTGGGFTCSNTSSTGDTGFSSKVTTPIIMPELANHGDMIPPPWDYCSSWSSGATFMGFADSDLSNYIGGPTLNPVNITMKNGSCPH